MTTADIEILIKQRKQGNALMQTEAELKRVDAAARQADRGLRQAGDGGDRMSRLMQKAGEIIKRLFVAALMEAGIAAVKFAKDSIEAFLEFDKGMREVLTLLPDKSAETFGAMKDQALALGTEIGRLPKEVMPALYQAISLGIPQDNVFEDLRIASEAAKAGVSDLAGTLTFGQSVVNAYGGEIYNLTEVYDIMFAMVRDGAITFKDLEQGFSKVTSVAGESRVKLEDIAAALVVMTRQGDSAAEAFELLSLLLMQLGIEGTAASEAFIDSWGASFREFINQGGTLAEALQLMENRAKDTGQTLGSMIGGDSPFFRDVQAARAALELTGVNMQFLLDETEKTSNAMGLMSEAAAVMGESAQFNIDKMKAAFEELKISVGETLGPWLTQKADEATNIFRSLSGNMGKATKEMIEAQVAQADSLEELIELFGTLAGLEGAAWWTGSRDDVQDGMREVLTLLAEQTDSYEEFREAVIEAAGAGFIVTDAYGDFMPILNQSAEGFYENALAMERTRSEGELWTAQLQIMGTTGYIPAGAAAELFSSRLETQNFLLGEAQQKSEQMTRYLELQARQNEDTAGATGELTEEIEDQIEPVETLGKAYENLTWWTAKYFGEALNAEGATETMEMAMLNAAIAAGVNIETLKAMAEATGAYSVEQIEAAAAQAIWEENLYIATEAAANFNLNMEQTQSILNALNDGYITSQEEVEQWATQLIYAKGSVEATSASVLGAKLGVDQYNESLERVPKNVETKLRADTSEAQNSVDALARKLGLITDKTVTVTVNYQENGTQPAGGGTTGGGTGNLPAPEMPTGGGMPGGSFALPGFANNGSFLYTGGGGARGAAGVPGGGRGGIYQNNFQPNVYLDRSNQIFVIKNAADAETAAAIIRQQRSASLENWLRGEGG